MFAAVGIACLGVGIIAILAVAVVVAMRLRRLLTTVAALRRHPMLDSRWLERQAAVVRNLTVNAAILKSEVEALAASILRLAEALEALGAIGNGLSRAIEELLGNELPWLGGLLAASRPPRSI